jgi:excisionase family DNA binding protein
MTDTGRIPGYLNVREAAEYLGHKERSTVLHLIKSGKLRTVKPGPKLVLIEIASLDEYRAKRKIYNRKLKSVDTIN